MLKTKRAVIEEFPQQDQLKFRSKQASITKTATYVLLGTKSNKLKNEIFPANQAFYLIQLEKFVHPRLDELLGKIEGSKDDDDRLRQIESMQSLAQAFVWPTAVTVVKIHQKKWNDYQSRKAAPRAR